MSPARQHQQQQQARNDETRQAVVYTLPRQHVFYENSSSTRTTAAGSPCVQERLYLSPGCSQSFCRRSASPPGSFCRRSAMASGVASWSVSCTSRLLFLFHVMLCRVSRAVLWRRVHCCYTAWPVSTNMYWPFSLFSVFPYFPAQPVFLFLASLSLLLISDFYLLHNLYLHCHYHYTPFLLLL